MCELHHVPVPESNSQSEHAAGIFTALYNGRTLQILAKSVKYSYYNHSTFQDKDNLLTALPLTAKPSTIKPLRA